jgi:hypothetical protein
MQKIVCEERLEFQPKNEDDFFSSKQKFVRLPDLSGRSLFLRPAESEVFWRQGIPQ